MAEGSELFLNIHEDASFKPARRQNHNAKLHWSYKKKKAKQKKSGRGAPNNRDTAAIQPVARAGQNLKGYSLDSPATAEPARPSPEHDLADSVGVSKAAPPGVQMFQLLTGTQSAPPVLTSRKPVTDDMHAKSAAHRASAAPQKPKEPRDVSKGTQREGVTPSQSYGKRVESRTPKHSHAKTSAPSAAENAVERRTSADIRSTKAAGAAKPPKKAAPEEIEPVHKSDDEDDDVLAAVLASKRRDAELVAEAGPAGLPPAAYSSSDEDESENELGVVSFGAPGTVKPRKKRKLEPDGADRKGKKEKDGAEADAAKKKPKVAVRPGELAHTDAAAPSSAATEEFFSVTDRSTFAGLGLAQSLSDHLAAINFVRPTRAQQASIPALLRGRDALISAPTGSGKTLCYVAPLVHDLQGRQPRLNRADGTHAIIIAPTRELCVQIQDVLATVLQRYHWLVAGTLLGGENRNHEKSRLRRGVMVLVATPGRLLDHLRSTAAFRTQALRWLVLDEADRLLDLGFGPKIAEIVEAIDGRAAPGAARRQTVLLSATMHTKLGSLAALSLTNPVPIGFKILQGEGGELEVAPGEDGILLGDGDAEEGTAGRPAPKKQAPGAASTAGRLDGPADQQFKMPSLLQQRYMEVPAKLRLVALAAALRSRCRAGRPAKLVVFLSSCDGVDFMHSLLGGAYTEAAGEPLLPCPLFKLHGNLAHRERTESFLEFSRCKAGVLLCTDVAARGLDFPAVTSIIQYDPPGEPAEYVHRVGRTARLGRRGEALLLVLPSEAGYVARLEAQGVALQQEELLPLLACLPPHDAGPGWRRDHRSAERHSAALALQKLLGGCVAGSPGMKAAAAAAFRSFVRAYSSHPASLKDIFHVRRLHLGHVAHSFGLSETPTMIGHSASKQEKLRRQSEVAGKALRKKKRMRPSHDNVD